MSRELLRVLGSIYGVCAFCFLAERDIPRPLFPPAENETEINEAVGTSEGHELLTRREEGKSMGMHGLV